MSGNVQLPEAKCLTGTPNEPLMHDGFCIPRVATGWIHSGPGSPTDCRATPVPVLPL